VNLVCRLIVVLALLAPSVSDAATTRSATRPATRSATAPLDPRLVRAQDLARQRRLAEIPPLVEPRLREMLARPATVDPEEVILLASLREFARYFARTRAADAGLNDTLAWLPGQPRLFPVLMMTATVGDPPDRVLGVLRALRADFRPQLDEYADLTTAMCVVWDAPERFGPSTNPDEEPKIDAARVAAVFRHFVRTSNQARFAPKKTPPELLAYVVDVGLTDDELRWAASRYGSRVDASAAFLDVAYRPGATYDPGKEALTDRSYVLPNILRRGGRCADAAYFAAEIAKVAGTPATVVRATGVGDGEAPAWVAYLQPGPKPEWNVGRYAEHAGLLGELVDPQTYETLPDAEVAVIAGLNSTPPRERLASNALYKLTDMVAEEDRPAALARSVELSPCNRRAWFDLCDFASAGKLTDAQVKTMEEMVQKHLSRPFPHFAAVVRLRMIKAKQGTAYADEVKRIEELFRNQPDVAARVKLAAIDRDIEDSRRTAAADSLVELLRRHGTSTAVAQAAMTRLDALLRKMDDLPRLEAIYRELFAALPRPSPRRWGRSTPYYRIGQSYAALLDEMKQPQPAQAVRVRIENTVLPND
jgi:hypothetical protein